MRTKRFTSLFDLNKQTDGPSNAAGKSDSNFDEQSELRKTRSGVVIKGAEDESKRKRLKALSKTCEVTSVVQLLRLVNCGAFECMSSFLQSLEKYLKALLHARGVDSSGEVEEGQEHDEEWAYVSLVFEMGDCVRAACFKIDRRLVRECEAAAQRRADMEAAVNASELAINYSGKGRLLHNAATASCNFDALDKFLRENKSKRLMSKKQRSQQAQSTPSAPPDTQVLSVGQASCRQEKALSEDDPSGGGDSDESGPIDGVQGDDFTPAAAGEDVSAYAQRVQHKVMVHVTQWPASDWNWDQALSLRSKIMASISYLRSTKDRMLLLEQLDDHFTNDA